MPGRAGLFETAGNLFDSGKIGVWTKADAATSFDDLTIQVPGK